MASELAWFRVWAYMIGMPGLLVAAATSALLAGASLLPPNLIWLCYLMPVVFATVRWGLASAAVAVVAAGLAGDYFFTLPYYSLWMEDGSDAAALLLFLLAGFGSALLITNLRQTNNSGSKSPAAVRAPLIELSQCQTSRDVIVHFNQWISVVAQGRAAFIDAQHIDSQHAVLPEEIQRVATGMCGTKSDDVREIAGAANRRWFLKQFRPDGIIRGTLAVETKNDACDRKFVEAAITRAAIRFSELSHRETLAAAADYVSDPRFSHQWRTSLTTILGAASVLLMRGKLGANHLERTLVTDIRDEAVHLSQLLTNAFPPRARLSTHDLARLERPGLICPAKSDRANRP